MDLSKYFSSIYYEALLKPFIFPTFAVTNNVNIDKIFKTDKKSLKKAFTDFSFFCTDKNVGYIIKKAMRFASSKGGEVSADNYRKNIDVFANILQKYSETELRIGGNAGNVSVALACLKNDAYVSGSIRNDYYGKFILNFLKEKGVKTDFLNTLEGKQAVTFCI
ncbi:MAG: carbohydrate kinase family protein [Candidatus Thermoplasmatota archaeon]|nr:carbohydrate kinase family protein [Candidatus Thermoplasmatota archaeon]